jgi:molybdopterin biosynthesis enzyme MoaB
MQQELNAGVETLLERATAAVYNKLVVFALPRKPAPLRRAVRDLVLPTAAAAVRIATGGVRIVTS